MLGLFILVVFFKQKTAYEMRISDWSSDVCSSDLGRRGWSWEQDERLSAEWLETLSTAMANYTRQRVDPTSPICSTSLPSGERVQIVAPPACELGRYSITIRKPSTRTFGLDQLETGGLFETTTNAQGRNGRELSAGEGCE